MSNKKRICVNKDCEKEYTLSPNKPGMINTCWQCGAEEDKDTKRVGAVVHYPHKTGAVIVLMDLEDAKEINRRTDRVGGQGIIKGMATNR